MSRSRMTLIKDAISICFKKEHITSSLEPSYDSMFGNYHTTFFIEIQIDKSRICVAYQQRPGGGEANVMFINKPLGIIKKDIASRHPKVLPSLVFRLNKKTDGKINLGMGPESGRDIDMFAFHRKFHKLLLSFQEIIGTLVYEENFNRSKRKKVK